MEIARSRALTAGGTEMQSWKRRLDVMKEGLSLALDGGALVEHGHGWQRQRG